MKKFISPIRKLLEQGTPFALLTIFGSNNLPIALGSKLVYQDSQHFWSNIADTELEQQLLAKAASALQERASQTLTLSYQEGQVRAFIEILGNKDTLLIVGAGHIAIPLCIMGKLQGFQVIILDDRPDYANHKYFPEADQILVGDFQQQIADFPFTPHTYVVLVTRGHTHDKNCLVKILGKSVAYIGMIGSLRRLQGVFQLLEQENYPPELLKQIHAPIGLPLGGDSPERIALSIMAEIVSVCHRGPEWSLRLKTDYRKLDKSQRAQNNERRFGIED